MAEGDRRLLRTSEVATALGVDRSTVYRWQRAGVIRPENVTHGKQARWVLDDVRKQLAEAGQG